MYNASDIQQLRKEGLSNREILERMAPVVPSAAKALSSIRNDKTTPDWQMETKIGAMLDKGVPKNAPSGLKVMNAISLNHAQKKFDAASAPPAPTPKSGFFNDVHQALDKRVDNVIGARPDSVAGRIALGQQTAGSAAFQTAGQGAAFLSDIAGAGMSAIGRGISKITPDSIEKPIVDTAKAAFQGVAESPVGQAIGGAVQGATDLYGKAKELAPAEVANLEAAVNIGSILPVGEVGAAGKGALSGVDDVARGLAKPIRDSAEASVARVLNPTTNATKATTQKIAGELVDRPLKETLSLTRKGMEAKAGAAAEVAGGAIDDAGALAGKTRTSELINYLQSQKEQFMAGGKVVNREGVNSIDEVSNLIAQYGDDVGNETLRDIRKIFDAEFYQGKKNIAKSAAETSTLNFKKQAADKIRGILAEQFPDIAKLNKEFSFWSSLEDVLAKTVSRKTGQKGAIKAVATVGGAVAGQGIAGSVAGALAFRTVASLIDSPAWGFVSAKIKSRIADALAHSNLSEIGTILGSLPGLAASQALPDEQ